MGRKRVPLPIGLLLAFAPIGVLVAIAMSGSCGKTGSTPDGPHGFIDHRTPVSTAKLTRATPDPSSLFVPIDCDQRFPSPGMRFVEERVESRRSVTIDEVDGSVVTSATIVREDGTPDLWSTTSIVGPRAFSVAVARGSVPALEEAVARLINDDESPEVNQTKVHLSAPRHDGTFDTFDVTATWHQSTPGMMKSIEEDGAVSGMLLVRASDGALVDLVLEGTTRGTLFIFGTNGSPSDVRQQPIPATHVKRRISRPCFRSKMKG
jgi:hypothetical protein